MSRACGQLITASTTDLQSQTSMAQAAHDTTELCLGGPACKSSAPGCAHTLGKLSQRLEFGGEQLLVRSHRIFAHSSLGASDRNL